jgi:YD repeat-containing protein
MITNAHITTRTAHSRHRAAVRRAALRSFNPHAHRSTGNLISVKDAKGNTHRYEYDKLDRMVKEIRPMGQTGSTGSPQALAYAYDANGNLSKKF